MKFFSTIKTYCGYALSKTKAVVGALSSLLLPAVGLLVPVVIVMFFKEKKADSNAVMHCYESMGGNFLMGAYVAKKMDSAYRSIAISTGILPSAILSPSLNKRTEYESIFAKHKRDQDLPKAVQEELERLFREWDALASANSSFEGFSENDLGGKIKTILIDMPYKRMPPILAPNLGKIQKEICSAIENYDSELQSQIRQFVIRILDNINRFALRPDLGGILSKVKPIFLLGPSGVGKTYLVEKISKITGIPFVYKSLANKKNEDIDGSNPHSREVRDGIIVETLIEAGKKNQGCQNVILFLDEVDNAFKASNQGSDGNGNVGFLREWILKFLEDETHKITSRPYRIDVDVSNIIVVMAGNTDFIKGFEESAQGAYSSRMATWCFPPLTREAQRRIGMQCYLDEKNKIEGDKTKIEYDKVELDTVNAIIAYNTEPGVKKMLRVLKSYITHIRTARDLPLLSTPFNIEAEYASLRTNDRNKDILSNIKKASSEFQEACARTLINYATQLTNVPCEIICDYVKPANPMPCLWQEIEQRTQLHLYTSLHENVCKIINDFVPTWGDFVPAWGDEEAGSNQNDTKHKHNR